MIAQLDFKICIVIVEDKMTKVYLFDVIDEYIMKYQIEEMDMLYTF